jgi:phosphatidylglycerol:prolipoprotein diacylglycerol transferase
LHFKEGAAVFPSFLIFERLVYLYGVFGVAGFAAGILLAVRRAKKFRLKPQESLFMMLYAAIGVFIGAKILYFITVAHTFFDSIGRADSLRSILACVLNAFSGFVFYGGLLGGIFGVFLYCRLYNENFDEYANALVPSIPLIHAVARVGCFFAGCCYGVPAGSAWYGVVMKPVAALGPLVPVQLIESLFNSILCLFLIYITNRPQANRLAGLGAYLTAYPVARFFLEYLRYDQIRGFVLGLSTSQLISILLLPVGIFLLLPSKSKKRFATTKY